MLILGKSPIGITYIQIISARKKLCHTFLSLSKSYYHYDLLQKIKSQQVIFLLGFCVWILNHIRMYSQVFAMTMVVTSIVILCMVSGLLYQAIAWVQKRIER